MSVNTSSERILVVRNPASSHADQVEHDVMDCLYDNFTASRIQEFWTPSSDYEVTTAEIAAAIQPGDSIIVAAGDGTGNATANAYLQANAEGTRLGFLPYGNFNDMAATFTDKAARKNPALLLGPTAKQVEVHPLNVIKNGEHYRFALLYATLGWTAVAAKIFDDPLARQALQSGKATLPASLLNIAQMYFRTRSNAYLPPFRREGSIAVHEDVTDVLAINGPTMARIIKSQKHFYAGGDFLSCDLDVSKLYRNIEFLGRSGLNFALGTILSLPGTTVEADELLFDGATVPVQLDGECSVLENTQSIRITKQTTSDARTITVLKTTK